MPPSVTFSKGWRGHDSVLEDFVNDSRPKVKWFFAYNKGKGFIYEKR